MAPTGERKDKRASNRKTEDTESLAQGTKKKRKKGHEKGETNNVHIYRKDERVMTRVEVHHQPDEEVQSQDLKPGIQSQGPAQGPVAHGSKTEEPLVQKEQYPISFNQAINFKCTGAICDVLDSYSWHTFCELCKTLDQEDLYYKYLHQDICPYRQSGWLVKTPGDVADWNSAIITGKGVEFNRYKERLLVVEKISTLQSYEGIIEHLRNQMELEELSKELNNRLDIKQLVIDINRELRKLVEDHRQMFYSNGQFSHCSVQVSPHSDKVRGTKYYTIHVVFHIQRRGYQQETLQWWISCCNSQTIAAGRRTIRRECDVIIQEYDNWVTSKKQYWRTTDEKGQDWKFYLVKEPIPKEEKVQQAVVDGQEEQGGQELSNVSSTNGASDVEKDEGGEEEESNNEQETS